MQHIRPEINKIKIMFGTPTLPAESRDLSVGPDTSAKHLEMQLFRVGVGFSDGASTFEFI